MTPNRHNHIRNRFYIPELVTLEVLHMWLSLKTKNLIFSSWLMAAILDLMIAELLPRLWTTLTIHCLFFITLSKNKILSQMKYHWIDKGYSFKTHIHILPSMLHYINRSCRNTPISCKFHKLFIFFLKSSL